ncbi:MAG: hypothetical protein FVQ85_12530 [Planctomycetes bacterium]|nr:hypothetical protein [Planctomycetota bacterium]
MILFVPRYQKFIWLTIVLCRLVSAGDVFALCPEFESGYSTGTIQSADLDEASGLAGSRKNPYVLWTHNDKGDSARIFAMNMDGTHLGIYNLSGATNRDWEDIAVGPGPVDGICYIYVGDIGDNDAEFSSITVYRVPEPEVDSEQAPVNVTLEGVEALTLRYPDGAHNAETLMVDPVTKDIYIITKKDTYPRVYRAAYPHSTTATITMEYKCELPWLYVNKGDWASGGDISPAGTEVIVRNYETASIWQRPADSNLWEAFAGPECSMALLKENQCEAVCFVSGFACGFMMTSEGSSEPLYYYPRIFEGDFDKSCRVDFDDLRLFGSAWGSSAGDDNYNPDYDISDISFDFIDEHDLAVFVYGWLSEI